MIGRRWIAPVALLAGVVLTIGCDRVTKRVAADVLAGTPGRSYLGDTIRLAYAENTGGFLSLGAELPPAARTAIFTVGNGLLIAGMVVLAIRSRYRGWALAGVALFAAGGLSNLIDRVVHGAVVDFLNVGIGPVRTGVFNVADIAIMVGVLIVGSRSCFPQK